MPATRFGKSPAIRQEGNVMPASSRPPDGGANTLVISSGRCGSTLVADMIGDHPDVLPLIEFFGSQYQAGMTQRPMTGDEFWALLTTPWLSLNTALRLDWVPGEVRYDLSSGPPYPEMSGLLAFTLPAVTDDPDGLFADLAREVPAYPLRTLGRHYRALFERLLHGSGRRRWVEKSAASPEYAHELVDMLPGVRVVQLTRDVIDVAISMTNHPMFVFADLSVLFTQRCGFDPFVSGSTPPAGAVPDDLVALLPEKITRGALDARAGSPASLMNLVIAQAQMARLADEAVAGLGTDRVHRLRYEDLLADPQDELSRLAAFLDFDDPTEWITRSAACIRPARAPRMAVSGAERSMLMGLYEQVYQATVVPQRGRAGSSRELSRPGCVSG